MSQSVLFCLFPGRQTFFPHRRGGNISYTQEVGGDKLFSHTGGGQTFYLGRWGQTFFVGGSGGFDDVDKEIDVSKANNFVSEASKLFAEARILGARRA